jgi:hypothetical protein
LPSSSSSCRCPSNLDCCLNKFSVCMQNCRCLRDLLGHGGRSSHGVVAGRAG